MTETMIERVAKAILKRRFYDCEPDAYGHDLVAFFGNIDPDHVIEAHDEARAAIGAMREPTDAQIDILTRIIRRSVWGRQNIVPQYRDLIDAALGESDA